MVKHLKTLENLITDSHKNTELLHGIYFKSVDGEISDEEILKTLSEISNSISIMQSTITHQLKAAKKHK